MRWTALALLALAITASVASARTTREFLDRCDKDEYRCAADIKAARRALEQGPRERMRLCVPATLSDDDLVAAVTGWIRRYEPPLDDEEDAESIAAALVALYACDRAPGIEDL